MNTTQLLVDAFGRIREVSHGVLDGLTPEELGHRPDGRGNPIGWLVWHLTRIQDDHVAEVAGREQVWTAGGWAERSGIALDPADTGYGHDDAAVAAVVADPSAELLAGYLDAVLDATSAFLETLDEDDLDRVVDERWDPPVTLGVRLVSVVSDDLQHLGQAAYVRGLLR